MLTWSRDFPATPDQASGARQFLGVILAGHPAGEDACLCLSELVTNAMLHSRSREPGGLFTVRVLLHGSRLRVEVHDQGGPWRQPATASTDQQDGRGLLIVDQLAAAWGRTGDHQAGWTVWFEIGPCPGHPWIICIDGHRLGNLRRQHQLTRAELASKAGISTATVARLEQHRHPACRTRTLARLAAALGEDPAALVPASRAEHPGTQPRHRL
jgi:anti-sigma regulatory factor (Ser/Thr protein kinase)/DNA-binding Xre family transcriptional regulator